MIGIPQAVKDFYAKDNFYIVANDKPCQSIIQMIEDAPREKDMEEFLQREKKLRPHASVSSLLSTPHSSRIEEPAGQPSSPVQRRQVKKTPYQAYVPSDFKPDAIIDALTWHMDLLSEFVIGREDIIRQAVFSILTGEHMLILSRTGMAKSYLVNAIFNIFEGARIFSSQASKDQTPDNYFGPYDIDDFRKGRIRHNIKGSIIEANLVFLDEFFDASDVVLRSLLSVLNERKFINGQEQIDASVHTAIATANYMRLNEVTEAVLDRFTYKSIIPETNNTYEQLMIDRAYEELRGRHLEPEQKIYFDQILYLHEAIKRSGPGAIRIPDEIYFLKNVMVNKYMTDMRLADSTFFVSPRKQAKLSDFLRASAMLDKRDEVTIDDLKNLHLALCTLNSVVPIKSVEKEEKDVYLDVFQKTMTHFTTTGVMDQINFLIKVRSIFDEIMRNPRSSAAILKNSPSQGLSGLLKSVFPGKKKIADETMTVVTLKNAVVSLVPSVEEVHELKNGILRDYRELS